MTLFSSRPKQAFDYPRSSNSFTKAKANIEKSFIFSDYIKQKSLLTLKLNRSIVSNSI